MLNLFAAIGLAAPLTMTHQGRLLDASGGPVDGSTSVQLRLFGTESGGSPVWTGDAATIPVASGYFTTLMTGGAPTLDTDLFAGDRWVEVWVDGAVVGPRQPIHPVPMAGRALSVGGGDIILPTASAGTCTAEGALATDGAGGLLLCTGGTYAAADTLPSGCADGSVLYRSGGDWTCTTAGTVLQELTTSRTAFSTATWTNGRHLSNQGSRMSALTITPTFVGSTLEVVAVGSVREPSNNSDNTSMGIYRVGNTSPLAITSTQGTNNPYGAGSFDTGGAQHETLTWIGRSTSTDPVTFEVRIGTNIGLGTACDRGPCTMTLRERL